MVRLSKSFIYTKFTCTEKTSTEGYYLQTAIWREVNQASTPLQYQLAFWKLVFIHTDKAIVETYSLLIKWDFYQHSGRDRTADRHQRFLSLVFQRIALARHQAWLIVSDYFSLRIPERALDTVLKICIIIAGQLEWLAYMFQMLYWCCNKRIRLVYWDNFRTGKCKVLIKINSISWFVIMSIKICVCCHFVLHNLHKHHSLLDTLKTRPLYSIMWKVSVALCSDYWIAGSSCIFFHFLESLLLTIYWIGNFSILDERGSDFAGIKWHHRR